LKVDKAPDDREQEARMNVGLFRKGTVSSGVNGPVGFLNKMVVHITCLQIN
jgi:hypothetical protein